MESTARPVTRRAFMLDASVSASLAAIGSVGPTQAALGANSLDPLQRFMKIYTSLAAETVWYWYSGTIDIAEPNTPVDSLIGVETLIRRAVAPQPDGSFAVTSWEANYYHGLGDTPPIDSFVNPRNGREIRPFHFREGPHTSRFTAQSFKTASASGIRSSIVWKEAGPYSWMSRELEIDIPHPLDITKWPMEASGPRNQFGSFSTHCAPSEEVTNPSLTRARCTFNYEAIFGWLPWLLMAQRPGYLVWRANGCKLQSLDELPSSARAGFDLTFPAIFARAEPWTDPVLLWSDYQKQRTPADW